MEESRERAYKFVAYTAVSFSMIAIVSVCITLPMIYNYVQSIQLRVDHEAALCKVNARGVLSHVAEIGGRVASARHGNHTLHKRGANGCEGCCLPGMAGPKGKLFQFS